MADVKANGLRFNVVRLEPDAAPAGGPTDDAALPTVVFLHGLIMDNLSSFYYTLAPGIAGEARVVLYDLRGHGLSERPLSGYTIADAVEDLGALLDSMGIDGPVHLVGNSFGGTIALAMAMRHPERVAGMALIEAHPVVAGWGEETVSRLEEIVAGFDDPGVRDWIKAEGGRKLQRMSNTCEELISQSSMPDDFRREVPWRDEELAAISCPTLCLYGEYSDIIDRAEWLAGVIPDAELRVLEGCSHSVLMEAPDELEEHVHLWLKEHR